MGQADSENESFSTPPVEPISPLKAMRTNVTFRHPATFVGNEEDGGGVLAASGVDWFTALLRRVPGLQLNKDLCQEDWGVVFFAQRNQKKFWIGLSAWDSDGVWAAHFHHASFAWFQWLTASGKTEMRQLLVEVHEVLNSEPVVTAVSWYEQSEISKPDPIGYPMPVGG